MDDWSAVRSRHGRPGRLDGALVGDKDALVVDVNLAVVVEVGVLPAGAAVRAQVRQQRIAVPIVRNTIEVRVAGNHARHGDRVRRGVDKVAHGARRRVGGRQRAGDASGARPVTAIVALFNLVLNRRPEAICGCAAARGDHDAGAAHIHEAGPGVRCPGDHKVVDSAAGGSDAGEDVGVGKTQLAAGIDRCAGQAERRGDGHAAVDGQRSARRAEGARAGELQRAGGDGRAAGVIVGGGQRQDAGADFCQTAATARQSGRPSHALAVRIDIVLLVTARTEPARVIVLIGRRIL